MWNEAVSICNTAAQSAVAVFSLHPVVGSAFVATQSVLVLLMVVELLAGDQPANPGDPFEGAISVRVKR